MKIISYAIVFSACKKCNDYYNIFCSLHSCVVVYLPTDLVTELAR